MGRDLTWTCDWCGERRAGELEPHAAHVPPPDWQQTVSDGGERQLPHDQTIEVFQFDADDAPAGEVLCKTCADELKAALATAAASVRDKIKAKAKGTTKK